MKSSICLITLLLLGSILLSQSLPGVYVIFDASGSMWGRLPDGSYKIHTAREVLNEFIGGDFTEKELALRVYGHRRKKDCMDSELVVPFGTSDEVAEPFRQAVASLNPTGRTPISFSLRQALKDFGDRSGDIILISDGIETCDEDPCALIRAWREKNINIQVHVVGFGVEEKAKLALQCIAEAAGTPYHNAESAEELNRSLSEIRQPKERTVLTLKGVDKEGNVWPILGHLEQEGAVIAEVKSNFNNQVPTGEYSLIAGIQTRNGTIYIPQTISVNLPPRQTTHVEVQVVLPPRVSSRFMDGETQEHGALIRAYQNGKEVFSFRPIDEVFIDEGSYEFRSKPDAENDLSVRESFQKGDRKEVLFQMVHAVRVYIRYMGKGTEQQLGSYIELYQSDEKKYRMTSHNGGLVLPGRYQVKSGDYFAPLPEREIVITDEERQEFDLPVVVGTVRFSYLKPDGSRDKDDRVFVTFEGKGRRVYQKAGTKYAYPAGRYEVKGWKQKGSYDPVSFEVIPGKNIVVEIRGK